MYYGMSIIDGALKQTDKKESFEDNFLVVEAPSEEAFWKVATKVEGPCSGLTLLSEIKMEVEREFIVADPVKFKGTPKEKITINEFNDFLKIKISGSKDVFIYVNINKHAEGPFRGMVVLPLRLL